MLYLYSLSICQARAGLVMRPAGNEGGFGAAPVGLLKESCCIIYNYLNIVVLSAAQLFDAPGDPNTPGHQCQGDCQAGERQQDE